ncbi:MAG: cell division protein ZapA [Marinagarivorans sp.]
MSKQHRVNLSLLEKEYQIACPPEEQAALITAAKEVERRMRTTRLQQGVVGAERIAVVVALNLCYELQQLQAQMAASSPVGPDNAALQSLLEKVQAALNEPQP